MVFTEGSLAQYKEHIGTIRFVCSSYLTLCISEFPQEPRRDVCILVYQYDFKKIKLLEEMQK
jgi:hypothetical protein